LGFPSIFVVVFNILPSSDNKRRERAQFKFRWIKKELPSLISVFIGTFLFEILEERFIEREFFFRELIFLSIFVSLIFLVVSWNYWRN